MIGDKRGVMVRTIILLVLALLVLVLVVLAVTGKLTPLLERMGGAADYVAVLIGLRDDDKPLERCFSEKVGSLLGGDEFMEYFEFDPKVSEVKICETWCRAGLGGSSSMDGTYLVEFNKNREMNFSIWDKTIDKNGAYKGLDYKTVGDDEKFERELYLAMREKVKDLKVVLGGEVYDAWLGDAGIGSQFGNDDGSIFYYGQDRSKSICLLESEKGVSGKWIRWDCDSADLKKGEVRYEFYRALSNSVYLQDNGLTFRDKQYGLGLEDKYDDVRFVYGGVKASDRFDRPFVYVDIDGKKYGIASEYQETKDSEGAKVSAGYTFYVYENGVWRKQGIDESYYLYVSEATGYMKDLGKIKTFLGENCR